LVKSKKNKANILIVFRHMAIPMRPVLWDLLYSFGKYSGHRVFYLNLAIRKVPAYLTTIPFELIVFHTMFLNARWQPARFEKLRRKVQILKKMQGVKVALPQDEFYNPKLLCEFINEFDIRHVFSVLPESEWKNIYRDVDFSKVQFHRVLTAYLGQDLIKKIFKRKRLYPERDIGIGYRTLGMTHKTHAWYGRHGFLKISIADRVKAKAEERGIVCDISNQPKDVINGDDWYWFLLRCKYQLGTEGGTSIMDWDGSLHERTARFVKAHPEADFDEIERNCFPGIDGKFKGFAISPRHLEACATETCQVLTEGQYNGILVPGKHYIELKKDFSNLDAVLDMIVQDDRRQEITRRAFQDIVASGNYNYERFTKFVVETSLPNLQDSYGIQQNRIWIGLVFNYMKFVDRINWGVLLILYQGGRLLRKMLTVGH
jgi:hypothetical protein